MSGKSIGTMKDDSLIRRYSGEISGEKVLFAIAMMWNETGEHNEPEYSSESYEGRNLCKGEQG